MRESFGTWLSGRTVAAVVATILAIVFFLLPHVFRIQLVASLGVVAAETVRIVAMIAGSGCVIAAASLAGSSVRQARQQKNAASRTELAASQWNTLPRRDETNPDVIEPALRRVAERFPEAAPMLEISLEQLASVRRSLDKIGDIFYANAGIVTERSHLGYAKVELLIDLVLKRICPGLVRIVYQAHEQDSSATSVRDLIEVINDVNQENQVRVDATRSLAKAVVHSVTEGDVDTATSQVETATQELKHATRTERYL